MRLEKCDFCDNIAEVNVTALKDKSPLIIKKACSKCANNAPELLGVPAGNILGIFSIPNDAGEKFYGNTYSKKYKQEDEA